MRTHSTNNVPKEWVQTTLGELGKLIRGVSYKKADARTKLGVGLVPILRATNLQEAIVFTELVYVPTKYVKAEQYLQPGDIVIAASSGSKSIVGKTSYLSSPWTGSFGAFCFLYRPCKELNSKYVAFHMQTKEYRERISYVSSGININNLKRQHIEGVPIHLAPFQEQGCIVEEIEKQFTRLDAAVEALKRVQANLMRYRASALKAAVEGRLVPTEAELARKEGRDYEPASELLKRILAERRNRWEEDYLAKMKAKGKTPEDDKWKAKHKEPTPPDTSNLPTLPEGWCWVCLGQLVWSVKDGPHYSPKYTEQGIPFISGGNVRPEGIDFDNAKKITSELHNELSQRCKPEKGDILYTKGGTTGIARVNTYDIEFNVWVHVAVLKLAGFVRPFYLQNALNSPYCYAQSQKYTHGVGNQDLGLTRMVNIVLPLPPLPEQERIVEEIDRKLSILEEAGLLIKANLNRGENLRQSVLRKAFQGQLVDQDPADEPASVLLERIRAERENDESNKKQKSRRPQKKIKAVRRAAG